MQSKDDDGIEGIMRQRNMPTGPHKYVYVMNVLILIFFSSLFYFMSMSLCVCNMRLWFCYFFLIEKKMSNWIFNNPWTPFLLPILLCCLYFFYFEEHLYLYFLYLFFCFSWMVGKGWTLKYTQKGYLVVFFLLQQRIGWMDGTN